MPLQGRNFTESEVQYNPDPASSDFVPFVILSKDGAKAIFGTEHAVGKTVYDLSHAAVVIGVMENMLGAWVGWDKLDNIVLFPRMKNGPTGIYLVRTEPGLRDTVMRDIEAKLGDSNPGRLLRWVRPFDYFIHQSYLDDRNMAIFMVSVTGALLAITALGIFGLATFNVSTRIRQIGTRRAVGARRMDIVRHFLVENWMVTTAGVVAGCGGALAIGHWISVKLKWPLPRAR